MTLTAPDPEPELEQNYPTNISPPPYDQHKDGKSMESKSPPPVELIVTLTNNVRIKYPSIEGTYLNPNSESKNQDWKSNPLKINSRSYWIQDNGLNAIWFDKKINQWNIGEKENLGRDQNYSKIKSTALYSYDIDWPYLVTEWFYKDVSLWNDWSTTKTDIIIEQGGQIETNNSVKIHTSQPTISNTFVTFDPKNEPFDASVDFNPKEPENKRKEQEAKKHNLAGPNLNFGGMNQSRTTTNNYDNRRDEQAECCDFFCDCCFDLLTSLRRCFRPPQPKWDCCSCDCDCGDCDCDCGDCDCDCDD